MVLLNQMADSEQQPLVDSELKQDEEVIINDEVKQWLVEKVELAQYYDAFFNNGYTSLHIIKSISNKQDLIEIGITLKGHQTKIMSEIKKLNEQNNDDDSDGSNIIDTVLDDWEINDDPLCIYICAIISLLFPLIGFVAMCCFKCGSGLRRRRRRAFAILVLCTIIGLIVDIITSVLYGTGHVVVL